MLFYQRHLFQMAAVQKKSAGSLGTDVDWFAENFVHFFLKCKRPHICIFSYFPSLIPRKKSILKGLQLIKSGTKSTVINDKPFLSKELSPYKQVGYKGEYFCLYQ